MCCGKTAGPIEMPLGMWVGVGRCNHVLDVGPDPPREGAILGANMGRPIEANGDFAAYVCESA